MKKYQGVTFAMIMLIPLKYLLDGANHVGMIFATIAGDIVADSIIVPHVSRIAKLVRREQQER